MRKIKIAQSRISAGSMLEQAVLRGLIPEGVTAHYGPVLMLGGDVPDGYWMEAHTRKDRHGPYTLYVLYKWEDA